MTATLNTTVAPTPISESTTTVPTRTASARIPLTRIVGVELRKMFDTRSGFWLMASIVITSVLATAAIIVFVASTIVDVSPFSTNGALVLANAQDVDRDRFYKQILGYAGIVVAVGPLLAWLVFVVVPSVL